MAIGRFKRKCQLTIDADSVTGSGSLTDFVVLLTEDYVPTEVLDDTDPNCPQSDGRDIRFSSDVGGVIELPFEIVYFSQDVGLPQCQIWVKIPSVAGLSDTTFYMWWGNDSASAYAATDTYGRNAVWSDYEFVSHDGGATDSTGNVATITVNNGAGLSTVNNHWGVPIATHFQDANGAQSYYSFALDSSLDLGTDYWSISFWANKESPTNGRAILYRTADPDESLQMIAGSATSSTVWTAVASYIDPYPNGPEGRKITASNGEWQYVRGLFAPNGGVPEPTGIQFNGGTQSTTISSLVWGEGDVLDICTIGSRTGDNLTQYYGILSEIRIRRNASAQQGDDWYYTEYYNQSINPAGTDFIIVGTPERGNRRKANVC